jgi:hypothetical protein
MLRVGYSVGMALLCSVWQVLGSDTVLLSEDFESPVVVGYDDKTAPDNGNWQMSTSSGNPFGWDRKGLHNEDDATFTTPSGTQGYSTRFYQGVYLTTKVGVVGQLVENAVYSITFNVAKTTATDGPYKLEFWALDGVSDSNRAHQTFNSAGTSVLIDTAQGTVSTNDMSHTDTINFSATSSSLSSLGITAGFDLAVRIVGRSSSAFVTYDNIVVNYTAPINGSIFKIE